MRDDQQRGALLIAAPGFARVRFAEPSPPLMALRRWLDSWAGIGAVATGMAR